MNLVGLMLWYKIYTIVILFIFAAFDKNSIQGIVDIFFKFLEVLFFNASKAVMNVLEFQNV